jgi:hypothetical protein
MANVLKMEDALKKADEMMWNGARAAKDRGAVAWTAEEHVRICGLIIRVLFHPKDDSAARLEPTSANYAAVFYALYNQSAWRQKFEKDNKVFVKKAAKSFDTAMDALEEEFGE